MIYDARDKTDIDFERWVTTDKLGLKLGVPACTIRQWIRRGKIDAIRYGNILLVDINTEYPKRKGWN